ncbi:MAG: NAD(P)H-dependent flavin oxidoreductase [Clostridiaceae bacterium]
MELKPLVIGDLVAKIPIIQGGMGVGVSLSNLAGHVAKEGAIGILSAAQIGYDEEDFETNTLQANLRALRKHIERAREIAPKGILGVNIMVAMKDYEEHVMEALKSGIDLIISGAGLPTALPKLAKGFMTKLAPIVSSPKAANVILKLWDKKHGIAPDMIVVEGPKAGGHLGFHKEDISGIADLNFEKDLVEIISITKEYEAKYNKKIPVVVAGGVYTGADIARYVKLGCSGVQMATRFVATHECDADIKFKEAYINSTEDTIGIVKSPVGMPGRAVLNKFIEKISVENEKVTKCYKCIVPCNPATTPYCITKALINAVKGDVDNGLVFCGTNAYRIEKIVSVKELIDELVTEYKNV